MKALLALLVGLVSGFAAWVNRGSIKDNVQAVAVSGAAAPDEPTTYADFEEGDPLE